MCHDNGLCHSNQSRVAFTAARTSHQGSFDHLFSLKLGLMRISVTYRRAVHWSSTLQCSLPPHKNLPASASRHDFQPFWSQLFGPRLPCSCTQPFPNLVRASGTLPIKNAMPAFRTNFVFSFASQIIWTPCCFSVFVSLCVVK